MKEYEKTGVLSLKDLRLPNKKQLEKGVAVIECVQNIPCNPCVDACPFNAISMEDVNALPVVDFDKCVGCGRCIGVCPGLAIFVVKYKGDKALISLPYEFLPVPRVNDKVEALDREGRFVDTVVVKKIVRKGKTCIVTVLANVEDAMDIRNIRVRR
ncbi:MAG: (4Fe-4S)-binding protein [Thermoplasmata archaeon]|nr:MAG: (4Fe-4S)-binding protein [Thermoplasmata archaeon]